MFWKGHKLSQHLGYTFEKKKCGIFFISKENIRVILLESWHSYSIPNPQIY